MIKLLRLIPLLALLASAVRADTTQYTITFTNRTWGLSNNITVKGTTRYFTNDASVTPASYLLTNSANGSATNYFNHTRANPLGGGIVSLFSSSNKVILIGDGTLTVSLGGSNWATLAVSTTTGTNRTAMYFPYDNLAPTNRTNQASAIVDGMRYPSNAIPTNSPALTTYLSLGPQSQELSNKIFNAVLLQYSTAFNTIISNSVRANIGLLIGTNVNFFGGTASNLALTNINWINGILGVLTNGQLIGTFITNAPSVHATNVTVVGKLAATNALLDRPWNTNAGGTFLNPIIKTDGDAELGNVVLFTNGPAAPSGPMTILFDSPRANDQVALLFNNGGVYAAGIAISTNSIFINNGLGVNYFSAYAGNLTLGSASLVVTNPGIYVNPVETNSLWRGTNILNGSLLFTPRANSALANGYNSAVILGTNVTILLSGPTLAYTNAGFVAEPGGTWHRVRADNPVANFTILNNSGLDATAANRITTGTGALVNLTNNPAIFELEYDAATARWILGAHSN